MHCPICNQAIANPEQSECACGESLPFWRKLANSSQALRQRGLFQAAQENYVGACASFLEAALANPHDQQNLIDAAKALAYTGCYQEARQLLEKADARYQEPRTRVLQSIHRLEEQAKKRAKAEAAAPPPASAEKVPALTPEPAPLAPIVESSAREPAPSPAEVAPAHAARALLGLGIMKRQKKGRKGFWSWGNEEQFPAIWQTVLMLENSWPNDWQSLAPWVHAAAQEAAKPTGSGAVEEAVFQYMLGLAQMEAKDHAGAVRAFERCLRLNPPVLNPATYFIYLHLDTLPSAQVAMKRLENDYDKSERELCRTRLIDRLAGRSETDKAALLRQVDIGKR